MKVPNLVTGFRLGLFVWFIYLVDQKLVNMALAVFILAWGLDVVDGWLARKLKQETRFGYMFDKVVDRMIIFISLIVLVVYGVVPVWGLFVASKDVISILAVMRQRYRSDAVQNMGGMGKMLATGQGVAIIWLMLAWPMGWVVILLIGVVGGMVGVKYVRAVYN